MPPPLDRRLLRRATATRAFLIAVAAIGMANQACLVVQAWLIARAVCGVFYAARGTAEPRPGLPVQAVALLGVFVLRGVLSWADSWLAHRASAAVKSQLRTDLMAARLAHPLTHQTSSAELILLVTQGLDALDAYFARYLPQLVMAAIIPLLVTGAICARDWQAAAIIALTLPLIPLFMVLIGLNTRDEMARRLRFQTRLANHFADLITGLATLQVFGRARAQSRGLAETEDRARTETMQTLRVAFLSGGVLELLAALSVALVAVSIGFRLVAHGMDLETALFVLVLAPEAYLPVRMVGVHFHDSADGTAAASRAFELIEAAGPQTPGTQAAPDLRRAEIRFERVGVRYPGASRDSLTELSFRLRPGELLALVGRSGGGKSTALAVLLGFVAPTRGRVLVDGVDLQAIDATSWRRQLALVAQTPGMIDGSVADNIALGDPGAGRAQLRAVLDAAGGAALELDRPVDEGGVGLSAGERRRVALARALLRIESGEANLLVLDEPTAGLDQATEARAVAGVRAAGVGAVVVSHRPALLALADEQVTVEAGEETGRPVDAGDRPEHTAADRRATAARSGQRIAGPAPDDPPEAALPDTVAWSSAAGKPQTGDQAAPGPGSPGRSAPEIWQLMRRLLRELPKGPARLAIALLLAIGASGSAVALMGVSAWLVSRAAEHPPVMYLSAAAVGVRFFGINRGVSRYLERLTGHDVALRMQSALRVHVYDKLSRTTLLGTPHGDLLVRIIADTGAITDLLVRVLLPFCSTLVVFVGTGLLLAPFSPPFAIVLLGAALLAGLVVPLLAQRWSRAADDAAVPARGELGARVREATLAAADLVAYGQERRTVQQLARVDARLRNAEARGAWTRGIASGLQLAITGTAVALALLIGGSAVATGKLAARDLAILVFVPLAIHELFAGFGKATQTLTRTRAALGRVLDVLAAEPVGMGDREPPPATGAGSGQSAGPAGGAAGLPGGLALHAVDVGWPGAGLLLTGVELTLAAGESVALTGPSGLGKTTLAATIMGLIPARGGGLTVPDRVGYLAQDAHIFATTLAENVKIGNRDATAAQIVRAMARAGLALDPQRVVGEQGATLSGGEARRVALARVLVAAEPAELVILDEPTEHLDHLTATALLDDLFEQFDRTALLVITHDPGLMARCDRVIDLTRFSPSRR